MCLALCRFSHLILITTLKLASMTAFDITKLKIREVEPFTQSCTSFFPGLSDLKYFVSSIPHCHPKP